METTSLTLGMFFSQTIPLTVATALVAFLWSRGILKSWLARIGWSLILGVLATLAMYSLHTGTLHGTGGLWSDSGGGIAGLFKVGFNFLALYYLVAGLWMVLGCLAVGIVVGVLLEKFTK